MKIVQFVTPSNVITLTEAGRETIYKVVKRSAFSMIVEKMASYPAIAA